MGFKNRLAHFTGLMEVTTTNMLLMLQSCFNVCRVSVTKKDEADEPHREDVAEKKGDD